VAEAREGIATSARGAASAQGRTAVAGFLAEEREFLQGLAGLVQRHAETVKEMARAARDASATNAPDASEAQGGGSAGAAGVAGAAVGSEAAEAVEAVGDDAEPGASSKRTKDAGQDAAPPATAEQASTVRIPAHEAPVRVEEPSPAVAARPDAAKRPDPQTDSLRELFWGEE
jgi:hypothetical protein